MHTFTEMEHAIVPAVHLHVLHLLGINRQTLPKAQSSDK